MTPPAAQALAVSGFSRDLAISPDGSRLVYTASANAQLMVREIDRLDAQTLAGITTVYAPSCPLMGAGSVSSQRADSLS